MHFTREPIVETVITARDGAKLLVRSARGSQESDTYSVEAVEVVIFGGAVFYRSASRPSPFLVPVGEYEVVECTAGRVHLKKPTERGPRPTHRENSCQGQEPSPTPALLVEQIPSPSPFAITPPIGILRTAGEQIVPSPGIKSRRGKPSGSSRGGKGRHLSSPPPCPENFPPSVEEKGIPSQSKEDVIDRASKILASLIPPPLALVSDSLGTHQNRQTVSNGQESSSGGRRVFNKRGGNRYDRERRSGREPE